MIQKPAPIDESKLNREWLRANPRWFLNNCLTILTKTRGLQPFRPNSSQLSVFNTIEERRARRIPPRLIVLKSRQVGISTLIEALFFSDCFLNDGRAALVLADTEPHALNLFRMTRRYNRHLHPSLRIKERADNRKELEFPWESRLSVETQGEVRSMTGQGLHLSEFAFYEDPKATIGSAMETMPIDWNTLAVIESTANGEGNEFHSMWCAAIELLEDPTTAGNAQGWVPVFIPWFQHEENRMVPWFTEKDLDEQEGYLVEQFKVSLDQLAWRRFRISEKAGDVETFTVENPATWQEAFALSGRPIFNKLWCDFYSLNIPPRGAPRYDESLWAKSPPSEIEFDDAEKKPVVHATDRGRLRIFKPYNPRHTYVIAGDPSEGDAKSDPSPLEVLDQMTLEQAAEWWGRTHPDLLGKTAAWLGQFYGWAQINAEANNHGIMFFATLIEMGYPNIYFRATHEEDVSGQIGKKPGLWETNKTKHAIFNVGKRWARENRGAIYSPILLAEMRAVQYKREDNDRVTKIVKPSGGHVDAAISWMIALYTHVGSLEAPMLPLPEHEELLTARILSQMRERDREGADRYAVDLIGMTCAQLDAVLEMKHQRKVNQERGAMHGLR